MSRIIALLQANLVVGDINGNAAKISQLVEEASKAGAQMALSTELAISGYPPRDLLLQADFIQNCAEVATHLDTAIPTLLGTPLPSGVRQLPGNGVIRTQSNGREVVRKQLLPTYDVFDEARYFEADDRPGIARTIGGLDVGVTICEDAWQHAKATPMDYESDPISQIADWLSQGVALDATLNLSASPYHMDKLNTRIKVARTASNTLQHPFLLANQVGGNDDLLFDGGSLAAWPDGRVVIAPEWQEGVLLVDIDEPKNSRWLGEGEVSFLDSNDEAIIQQDHLADAVITGLRDYCLKSGLNKIVLGLSRGYR